MKHILFVLFLFPALAFGQEVTQDSSVIFNQGGQFFKRQIITYADGGSLIRTTLLGDTLTTTGAYTNTFRQSTSTWANDVRYILTLRRMVNELIRQAADVKAVTGIDPLHKLYQDSVVFEPGWQISAPGAASQTLSFNTNAQGSLRYQVNGGTNRNAHYLGEAIRLTNYPATGDNMIFWRNTNGRYVDLRQQYTLIPPTQ